MTTDNDYFAEYSWDNMIAEFQALGGTIENVEQREGKHGLGLFPVNPSAPVKIHVPENLLIPEKWLKIIDGDLHISEESGIEKSVREFFTRYQKNFSWGRSGRNEALDWYERVNSFPEKSKQSVLNKLGIVLPEASDKENILLAIYINTRHLQYRDDNMIIMPIIELVNHSPDASGFNRANGILLNGTFENEIYVDYGARCDPLTRYCGYGFVCAEKTAFSLGLTLPHPEITVVVQRNYLKTQGSQGIDALLPVVEHSPGMVTLSFLALGDINSPRVPRSIFRRILPDLPHDTADEIFQYITHINIMTLIKVLRELDDIDSRMGRELREAIHLQLETISSCYGIRDLDTLTS